MQTRQVLLAAALVALALTSAQAQQVPIPKIAAEVPGPPSGTAMTRAPEPGLMGGVLPIAHNALAMLTNYVSPDQRFVTCTNQDVVYGFGFLDNLDNEPIVFQVPDFGDRFYVYALYDARTDELSNIGKQYGTKPGFYMVVGPNWKGEKPQGITAVLRSSTDVVAAAPRVFTDDTPEDHVAIQTLLSQIDFYPLSKFDGKMKTEDWSKLPHFPGPQSTGNAETKWVNPETFFDELPAEMKSVPPLPGEEDVWAERRWKTWRQRPSPIRFWVGIGSSSRTSSTDRSFANPGVVPSGWW